MGLGILELELVATWKLGLEVYLRRMDIGLATMWRELGLERLRNTGAGPGRYIGGVPGVPLRDAGA